MTKYVVRNDQVPHLWANQSQDHARGNGSISFRGKSLYSYAAEIARLHEVDGQLVALHTTRKWSNTTSSHQSGGRCATAHLPSFNVPDIAPYNHADNLAYLVGLRRNLVSSLLRSRSMPESYVLDQLTDTAARVRQYAELFNLPVPEIDAAADIAAITAHHNTPDKLAKRAAIEAREAAARQRQIDEAQATLNAWRAGDNVRLPHVVTTDANGGALIRVVGDEVQTSQGASVPLADAIKVFRRVAACRNAGITWHRNGEMIPVGSFHVDQINADGSFRAGCHRFSWVEVEAAAQRAGVAPV